jgi:hypothetical protein
LRNRWLLVGLVALILFAINLAARLVTVKGKFVTDSQQMRIGIIAVSGVAVLLVGAAAWWAVRNPFGRMVVDLGAAVGASAVLSVVVGPYVAGSTPFAGGLGYFVGQILLFMALAAVGILLGFGIVVALGKDWRSRGLRRYEQSYRSRPHRPVRG